MNLLKLLDRPIAYHRCFVPIAGSVSGAVFLSQLVYWTKRLTPERNGWLWKTREEWEDETGLCRSEQERARRALCTSNVMEEERRGIPAKMFFKLNLLKLNSLLESANLSEAGELDHKDDRESTHKFAENCHLGGPHQQTMKETTAKITQEAAAATPPAAIAAACRAVKKRRKRQSGIVIWCEEDETEAARIEAATPPAELAAAIKSLQNKNKKPLPGLVCGELDRLARQSDAAAKEAVRAESDAAQREAEAEELRRKTRPEQVAAGAAFLSRIREKRRVGEVA